MSATQHALEPAAAALVGGWFWWPYVDRCEIVRGTWLDGWCDYGGSSGAQ
jgi:uncharacterized membrane protein YdfJ with MMPL/SSD domain